MFTDVPGPDRCSLKAANCQRHGDAVPGDSISTGGASHHTVAGWQLPSRHCPPPAPPLQLQPAVPAPSAFGRYHCVDRAEAAPHERCCADEGACGVYATAGGSTPRMTSMEASEMHVLLSEGTTSPDSEEPASSVDNDSAALHVRPGYGRAAAVAGAGRQPQHGHPRGQEQGQLSPRLHALRRTSRAGGKSGLGSPKAAAATAAAAPGCLHRQSRPPGHPFARARAEHQHQQQQRVWAQFASRPDWDAYGARGVHGSSAGAGASWQLQQQQQDALQGGLRSWASIGQCASQQQYPPYGCATAGRGSSADCSEHFGTDMDVDLPTETVATADARAAHSAEPQLLHWQWQQQQLRQQQQMQQQLLLQQQEQQRLAQQLQQHAQLVQQHLRLKQQAAATRSDCGTAVCSPPQACPLAGRANAPVSGHQTQPQQQHFRAAGAGAQPHPHTSQRPSSAFTAYGTAPPLQQQQQQQLQPPPPPPVDSRPPLDSYLVDVFNDAYYSYLARYMAAPPAMLQPNGSRFGSPGWQPFLDATSPAAVNAGCKQQQQQQQQQYQQEQQIRRAAAAAAAVAREQQQFRLQPMESPQMASPRGAGFPPCLSALMHADPLVAGVQQSAASIAMMTGDPIAAIAAAVTTASYPSFNPYMAIFISTYIQHASELSGCPPGSAIIAQAAAAAAAAAMGVQPAPPSALRPMPPQQHQQQQQPGEGYGYRFGCCHGGGGAKAVDMGMRTESPEPTTEAESGESARDSQGRPTDGADGTLGGDEDDPNRPDCERAPGRTRSCVNDSSSEDDDAPCSRWHQTVAAAGAPGALAAAAPPAGTVAGAAVGAAAGLAVVQQSAAATTAAE